MNTVIETIMQRRSCRQFSSQQIADNELEAILEAGRFAPSGKNVQLTKFIVVQNKQILQELENKVTEVVARMEPEQHPSLVRQIQRAQSGNLPFIYHAPTLIVMVNQRDNDNAIADCSCAMENMMIAAASLHIGSCYVNLLHRLCGNEEIMEYLMTLGIEEKEFVCSSLVLGYPIHQMPPLARTGNRVIWIR